MNESLVNFHLSQALVNPLQGFLNCFVYGQHKQFKECCKQLFEETESGVVPDTDLSTTGAPASPTDEWQINSFRKKESLPSQCSPLLVEKSHTESVDSSRAPFAVKLLGEFSR